ncbi:MAG: hypothetical protein IPM36_21640 [Lewinellaceae bacterium]|nr:hypothetical protein [Lewinellaceae bacterium]
MFNILSPALRQENVLLCKSMYSHLCTVNASK